MAYSGILVKVGGSTNGYSIPLSFIRADSYKATKLVQDLDSYRDTNGVLHRNAQLNVAYKIEFECVPMLTSTEISAVVGSIESKFSVPAERRASVYAYIPETDSYITQDMYMPDPEYQVYYADSSMIQYSAVRFAFIGYGT